MMTGPGTIVHGWNCKCHGPQHPRAASYQEREALGIPESCVAGPDGRCTVHEITTGEPIQSPLVKIDRERIDIPDDLWKQLGDAARALIALAHANPTNGELHRAAINAADAISNVRRFDRTQS